MSRRQGETILIGDQIEIVIAHIGPQATGRAAAVAVAAPPARPGRRAAGAGYR
jgi:sRNA-binding carbon storage regulator CsrA